MTFKKQVYTAGQIRAFWSNAKKDMARSGQYKDPDVSFRFSYDALIKLAIAVSAQDGVRVLSRAGHHMELLDYIAQKLGDKRIGIYGNRMRMKRNRDLYYGGSAVTDKEAREYAVFVRDVFRSAEDHLDAVKGKTKLL